MTISWHVDDCFVSHEDQKVQDDFTEDIIK